MMHMQNDPNAPITSAERAARSVFVGNIPYETTEEQLREIFSAAGPVVSFRLVYDRETGKPKGYGFCEYQDVETAQSAMRNLNNYDFNGRPLRVGVAAGEQNRDEMKGLQQALGGPIMESPYGDPVEPEKAPEAISKAVASLPPEQMFELMKQMKLCIQNNPTEARNMLLQNPQLAYALLQAQIVMKIVDPQVAMAMLHRDTKQIPPASVPSSVPSSIPLSIPQGQPVSAPGPMPGPPGQVPVGPGPRMVGQNPMNPNMPGPDMMGPRGPMMRPNMGLPGGPVPNMGMPSQPAQLSQVPGQPQIGGPGVRPEIRDPRMMGEPRMMGDPRAMGPRPGMPMPATSQPGPIPRLPTGLLGPGGLTGGLPNLSGGAQISPQDQEKAALIMQVLQLTDQQIAMLPPEQRQSILILKEQISKSAAQ
ncbi:cleavage stimulation factor subunit 2 tau variant-like [Ostrea edulis]|uniref:cleavage stimulation factor subunit 2 tau variant-like n=1 Tax=Ostrea edulis TaxID=37623 RepID=UPI002096385B|nr:cleavage stimulation factor subunit 2 tau variant-like [Ostrea edulis]